MALDFDVLVIGSGPGGYIAAIRAAQLGLKTAIVERELLGGICLNWGCIPTKALLKSGEVYEQLSHLSDYGLSAEKPAFDFDKVIARSRGVAKQLNQGVGYLMKKNKIEVIEGTARLEKGEPAPKAIIALKAGGERTVQAKAVILATGARAKVIPAIGPRAGWGSHLDLSRSHDRQVHAEVFVGRGIRRHRHRICQLLQGLGRRSYGDRGAGPHPAR